MPWHAVLGSLLTPCRTSGRCSRCAQRQPVVAFDLARNSRDTREHFRFAAHARGAGGWTRAPGPGGMLADSSAEVKAVARAAVRRGALRKCTITAPGSPRERREPPRERGFSVAVPVGFEPTVELPPHMFSRHDPSAARTRYRGRVYTIREARRTTAGPLSLHRRPVQNPRPQLRRDSSRPEDRRVTSTP